MRNFIMTVLLGVSLILTGCAASAASRQPPRVPVDNLNPGASRESVIMMLGAPVSRKDLDNPVGSYQEIYRFTQGYSRTAKILRTTGHVIGDICTLFLWEIIGWPLEGIFSGEQMAASIIFTKDGTVIRIDSIYQVE